MSSKLSDLVDNLSEIYRKTAKDAGKKEKSNQCANLLGLKIMNYVTNAKDVKKMIKTNK